MIHEQQTNQSPTIPILVVDDDAALRRLIARKLEKEGYQIIEMETGTEALNCLASGHSYAMLLDHRLPDMTGLDLVKQMRYEGINRPFVMMTGQGDESLAVEVMKEGAEDYLLKDTELLDKLPHAVKRLFKNMEVQERLQNAGKALQESEVRFRTLFLESPVSMLVHDKDTGELIDANPAAYEKYGFSSMKELKQNDFWMGPPYDFHQAREWIRKTDLEGPQEFEWCIRQRSGARRWLQMKLTPMMIDGVKRILVAGMDVTELKESEEALRKTQEKLKEQNLELELAKHRAVAASEAKSQFLSNMSHELRTPLNGLMGMIQLLQTTTLTEEQAHYIELSLHSCKSLTSVVNEVLNYTSLDKKQQILVNEAFSPVELLKEVIALHQTTAAHKGLTLHMYAGNSVPHLLVGDRFKLKQILGNLTGNGVKFTERGAVYLSMFTEESDKPDMVKVVCQVKDTGMGIDPDKVNYIFDRFSQADESNTRNHGGLGLGLPTAKELAELMGGSIVVKSTPGTGSCFTFTCDMLMSARSNYHQSVDDQKKPIQAVSNFAGEEHPLQVLVVDDDFAGRNIAKFQLEKMNCQVDTVENGREAVHRTAQNRYDLVLMDIQMPVMDGMEATRAIRKREQITGNRTPIVAMTAKVLPGDREECLSVGMDGYLAKPFEKRLLEEIVREYGVDRISS